MAEDGFKPASAWVGHGIAWLDEMQQFYRDRSAIEREYGAKLSALAKRYFDKKNKRSAQLSVGESPTMTPGSLERHASSPCDCSRDALTALESRAAEHDRFAANLVLVPPAAEPLKQIAARFEELRKRHVEYADKLALERDASYADLRKVKAKYDATCQDVEAKRKKSESHYDKAKAQSAYRQQILDMNNAKNTYIIAINVTNRQKEKYYHEYVPEIMDSLQDLSQFRTIKLNGLWGVAVRLETDMLQQSHAIMGHLAADITRNEPHLDSLMYMSHNVGALHEPPDKEFEPSPVWHDDDAMAVDETAKIYLRNVLTKSKSQLGELRREVDKKRREIENVKKLRLRVRDGTEKDKDEVEVVRTLFAMQEDLHSVDRRRLTAEIETSTITSVVGDVTLGAKNHNFKGQTFKIPTNCDLCGERIWGLSAKGFDCRDCGYTCHSKCEMKVPADCPGEQSKEERKKLKAERQETANKLLAPDAGPPAHIAELPDLSTLPGRVRSAGGGGGANGVPRPSAPSAQAPAPAPAPAPGRKRVMAPPPAAYISELPGSDVNGAREEEKKKGKMLYSFESSGEGELSVPEGREVMQLGPDDGSGWVKVRAGYKEGLVPATYVEFSSLMPPPVTAPRPSSTYSNSTTSSTAAATVSTVAGAKKKGPAVAPRRGAKKLRYVEALYEYAAQSDAEHSMVQGERFVLVKHDQGDGWAEVEKAGVTGSVPANYVQAV
ncbi:Fps/Fes/Fer/CIP4-like protein [Ophiocordyceps sinensis CO18]|uniref:Protein BZZ1 n=1 Tax=Ophiocordyceps sinensis (strain Co18 / CGMCC 3.14243) TaxID=911162 RepID=T5ANR2_OPHSC|nr:Fps/Fes/Fer/CIP4-like protein [Ophiocordyceps sinensis CO18]